MSRVYFVSDIHIKEPEESNSEKLLLFLHKIENEIDDVSHVFLVGDIFDLWIHNHTYFVDKYIKIVNAIKAVVAKGVEIHYFEGNHDLYLKRFWQQDVGVKVHDGPVYFNLFNKVVRVEHGDLMNPDDKGYLFLKSILQSFPMKRLAYNLPGVAVQWIGDRASRASRHYTSHQKSVADSAIRKFSKTYCEESLKERFFDFMITGHTHTRDQFKVDHQGEEVEFFNLGSWFDDQKALCMTEEGFEFIDIAAL